MVSIWFNPFVSLLAETEVRGLCEHWLRQRCKTQRLQTTGKGFLEVGTILWCSTSKVWQGLVCHFFIFFSFVCSFWGKGFEVQGVNLAEDFRKGDEIYGMTIESVVAWLLKRLLKKCKPWIGVTQFNDTVVIGRLCRSSHISSQYAENNFDEQHFFCCFRSQMNAEDLEKNRISCLLEDPELFVEDPPPPPRRRRWGSQKLCKNDFAEHKQTFYGRFVVFSFTWLWVKT